MACFTADAMAAASEVRVKDAVGRPKLPSNSRLYKPVYGTDPQSGLNCEGHAAIRSAVDVTEALGGYLHVIPDMAVRRYLATLVNVLSAHNRMLEQLVREHVRVTEGKEAHAGFLFCSRMWSHVSVRNGLPLAKHKPYSAGEVREMLKANGQYVPEPEGEAGTVTPGAGGRAPEKKRKRKTPVKSGAVSTPVVPPVSAGGNTSRKRPAVSPANAPAAKRSASNVPASAVPASPPVAAKARKKGAKGSGTAAATAGSSPALSERALRLQKRAAGDGAGKSATPGSGAPKAKTPCKVVKDKAKKAMEQAGADYGSVGSIESDGLACGNYGSGEDSENEGS